jgi:hypothetical protein
MLVYDRFTDSFYNLYLVESFLWSDYKNSSLNQSSFLTFLDLNNVSTPVLNDGSLFWDLIGVENRYSVPQSNCNSPIFADGLWIGGLDDTSGLHPAAMTYRQRGRDFWPGPLAESDGSFNPEDSIPYDRLWKINKTDVNHHIQLYNQNGSVSESQIPEAFLSWPAHRLGLSSGNLAPFKDQNGNGIYEPGQGDYPLVPEDQAMYWIMNDNANIHSESTGSAFGVEVQTMAYQYTYPNLAQSDSAYGMNNTTAQCSDTRCPCI